MSKERKIAIFGGAFDPPTNGHASIIKEVLDSHSFDELWIMPSKSRIDKRIRTPDEQRLRMVVTMIKDQFGDYRNIKASDYELKMRGITKTYKTIRLLQKEYPDCVFTFVIGEDSLATMPRWDNGKWLLKRGSWLVVPRLEKDAINQLPAKLRYLPAPPQAISSTQVREAVYNNESIRALVNPWVARFIYKERLYHE